MKYYSLKNVMKKYIGDIVDSEELEYLFVNDLNQKYELYPYGLKECLTHLHKCVLLTKKYPALHDYIKEYLKTYNNIDMIDLDGDSALHYASKFSNTLSTEMTVEILIGAGAKVNLQNIYGFTPLHYVVRYFETTSTQKTIEILITLQY